MTPFRILIIDDGLYEVVGNPCFKPPKANEAFGFITDFLIKEANGNPRSDIEMFVSKDGAFESDPILEIVSNSKHLAAATLEGEKLSCFLRTIHILVLDLGGITIRSPYPDVATIQKNLFNYTPHSAIEPSQEDLAPILTGNVSGVGFYHQHLNSLSRCAVVAVLTKFDHLQKNGVSTEVTPQGDLRAVERFLEPFCAGLGDYPCDEEAVQRSRIPWTIKFPKDSTQAEASHPLKRIIDTLHRDYTKGFCDLTNRGAIEFAASTDYPVLIVGESGTGKEGIANSIRYAWEQRRNLEKSPYVILNCAGLSSELARSELFGHVKGSFTDADDHRLGAILHACGISDLGSAPEDQSKDQNLSKNALALAKALQEFQVSKDINTTWEDFIRQVLVTFQALFNPLGSSGSANPEQSLIGVMNAIRRRLQTAASGGGLTHDFRDRLLDGSNGKIVQSATDDLDLNFLDAEPVGTLFLDEFGDLPSEVQNLLLRFLEERTREIQPVGYPGRISGLKAKIIVATSDPRVAQFAGVELRGAWRSESENARPLRADLLQRVCYHVIRAEPVETDEQIERCINALVTSCESIGAVWDTSATAVIKEKVKTIIEEIRITSALPVEKRPAKLPWFGHRRQLSVVIRLACEYVRTAHARGLRGDLFRLSEDGKPIVTGKVIKKVWRAASVFSPTPTRQPFQNMPVVSHHLDETQQGTKKSSCDEMDKAAATLKENIGTIYAEYATRQWDGRAESLKEEVKVLRKIDPTKAATFCNKLVAVAKAIRKSAKKDEIVKFVVPDIGRAKSSYMAFKNAFDCKKLRLPKGD